MAVQKKPLDLSPRERDVLRRIVRGDRYTDIANRLHLSYETIKTVTNRIRAKLGVRSKAELAERGEEYFRLQRQR